MFLFYFRSFTSEVKDFNSVLKLMFALEGGGRKEGESVNKENCPEFNKKKR